MKLILVPLAFAILGEDPDFFPDKVADPKVEITHKIDCDLIKLPMAWAQAEKWQSIEPAKINEDGTRSSKGKKVQESVLAMDANEWSSTIQKFTPLKVTESANLPSDGRLLLHWSSSALEWSVDPAFMRNPPAKKADQITLLKGYAVFGDIVWDKPTLSMDAAESMSPDDLKNTNPIPLKRTWYCAEVVDVEGIPEVRNATQGELSVTSKDESGIFSCVQTAKGKSILVIAKSSNGDAWLWFVDR